MKRYFNTSGPNIPEEHYTLMREDLIKIGKHLVFNKRYFTIWAPRQTGKSTYFLLLKTVLEREGYKVFWMNVENYLEATLANLLRQLRFKLRQEGLKVPILPTSNHIQD